MFPDGMVVKADNKLLLTDNIEELFFIIGRFSESCSNKKSGASKMYFENSALVPKAGIEPALQRNWFLRPARLPIPPLGRCGLQR